MEKAKDGSGLLKQKHFKVTALLEDSLNDLDYAIVN